MKVCCYIDRLFDYLYINSYKELSSVVENALPSYLKTVSIFEDFDNQLALALRSDIHHLGLFDPNPVAGFKLVRAFASKSRNLEHLSISFMIDAQHFFNSCQLSYTWPLLRSLTLTSSILTHTSPRTEISRLLYNASLITLHMPNLESMTIWNGKRGEACAVIYHRSRATRQATLTWRGTWDLEFSHDVAKAWQEVTPESYHLRVRNEPVQGVISSHGDAVYHLHLPGEVINSESLWQIRMEGMAQEMT